MKKKYNFISVLYISNTLTTSSSSYRFDPDKIYEESEIINKFVKAFPDKFKLIIEEKIEVKTIECAVNNIDTSEYKVDDKIFGDDIIEEYNELVKEPIIIDEEIEDNIDTIVEDVIDDSVEDKPAYIVEFEEVNSNSKTKTKAINYLVSLKASEVKEIAKYYDVKYTNEKETASKIVKLIREN